MPNFDTVIIGSGIGGLICGNILSQEGHSVCILEKNKQIGGTLQTFLHEKTLFDAGVHYLGGLGKGQNLYQIFKYLGVMDSLQLQQMDEDAFDKIIIENDEKEYALAQGYQNFIEKLRIQFPAEERAIRAYCEKIREVCSKFPLYNLRKGGSYEEKSEVLEIDAAGFINSLTSDKKLRAVLSGNNILYAGRANETPFYVHALILNSYIESSWKCIGGGAQIAKILATNIKSQGGSILCGLEAKKIAIEGGKASYVETSDGGRYFGENVISGIHPAKTLEMTSTELIKPVYRRRVKSLENSVSSFMINIVLKDNTFPYFKHNYYYHREGHIWDMASYTESNWPLGYGLFLSAFSHNEQYARAMTIFTYMRFEDVKKWGNTFNTVSKKGERGDNYQLFKKQKAEILLDCVELKFPNLRNSIKSYTTATPLSYRDYIGSDDGSLYGIAKDYKSPMKTMIPTKTKVPNLYFTGQNLNLHGILGTAISGLLTCAEILGNDEFIEKIKNA